MYQELYLPKSKVFQNILFLLGLLLLPFSLLTFGMRDGHFFLEMQFDLAVFAASVTISLARFLPIYQKKQLVALPYYCVLVLLFCRFGTVTLFDRVIPFEQYIFSVFLMLSAFGCSFIFYFIFEGKMRTKVIPIVWGALMEAVALVSGIFSLFPFTVYDDITEGTKIFNISGLVVFILFNLAALITACFLKDDKVKAERARIKQEKQNKQ